MSTLYHLQSADDLHCNCMVYVVCYRNKILGWPKLLLHKSMVFIQKKNPLQNCTKLEVFTMTQKSKMDRKSETKIISNSKLRTQFSKTKMKIKSTSWKQVFSALYRSRRFQKLNHAIWRCRNFPKNSQIHHLQYLL